MYNVHMTIALFFIVLSAWCTEEFFDIPSCWTRDLFYARQMQTLNPFNAPIPDLKNIIIARDGNKDVEVISIDTDNGRMWLKMDCCPDYFANGSNNFEVCFKCAKCSFDQKGHVSSVPLDANHARFLVVEPKLDPDVIFVRFSTKYSHRPGDIFEYSAKEKSFTVRKFLCQYEDESCVFVRAQVPYKNPHKVVVDWGLRDVNGTVTKIGDKSPKEFLFHVCPGSPD